MTRRCRVSVVLLLLPMVLSAAASASPPPPGESPIATDACDVTLPNGMVPPASPRTNPDDWYGSGASDASLWLLMARGTGSVQRAPVRFDMPVDRYADGYPISFVFWRGVGSDTIAVTGNTTDGRTLSSDAFRSYPESVYPIPGFVPAAGRIPADGCWTFTATEGNDTLTWTVLVRSPFADCPVTSGTDDDDSLPQHVVTGPVDRPGDHRRMQEALPPPNPDHYFGENGLYIALGDPANRIRRYPADSHLVSESGTITDSFMWYRDDEATGDLTVTVSPNRSWFPDAPEVTVPESPVTRGLHSSWITFPGEGCWEITGTSGGVSITFTVRLEIVPSEG